ncbi:S-layer homology domain-containing protein [Anaerotignum lactatifermentans]|uniref:S-layer homology domain-containing protein n=1 Tax=Anaerotignum lactatifermentans TaxID=160404 RepID=UPI003AB90D2C
MIKRFLSLLCVLALCLGLLPVTALAADGIELYVGGQRITESGCYANQDGTWTKVEGTGPSSGQFYYDAATATLTLNGATIQGGTSTGSVPYGAGIYAQCKDSESVSLTIELIGNNTITGYYGIYVNAEISENSNGTDASLTITGENNVSLEVSGSFYGIFVKSGTGNASVTIENASVDAKTTQTNSGYAGVCVQSGASSKDSPNLSLAVNGGSLTTSGSASGDGIQFVVGAHVATRATTSLTVTDNAIVDARNGGISASRTSVTLPTPTPTGNNSSGIVFDDKNGTVYGKVELKEDITINEGETLTVGKDASLTVPENVKLTNNGTIVNTGGTLNGEPGGTGKIETTPTIDTQPASQTVTAGETAKFSVTATGENLSYQWQQSTDNGNSWKDIADETNATYTTGKTTMDMNGTQYRCVVKNSVKEVTSNTATLTVTAIPTYEITVQTDGHGTASASSTTARAGEQITLTATPNSGYRFAGWTSSDNITFANAGSAQTTFTMPAKDTTITANWKKKSSGGSVFFWDLKFDTNGGSKIDTVTEWEYSTIDLDEYVPEKEGYKFVGWYADEDLTKEIDEVYLTQDTTVYAKWKKIEEEVPEEPEEVEETEETETISFKDVKENDWFYEAVSYAVENGLMSGMSEDIFAPNTPLTREMLAVILWNLEGNPTPNDVAPFLDVTSDKYYANAIAWANENGIVAGYGDTFGVGDFITREQFAVMLYNYAQYQGYDISVGEDTNILSYTDAFDISNYAYPAMQWACGAGIMSGNDDGTLNPQGKATRAEAATMLMNFCENVVK